MTIILKLKNRPINDALQVNLDVVHQIMRLSEDAAGRQLYKMFKDMEQSVHDKMWLTMIVNWIPKNGVPMTKMMPWLKLAERVSSIKEFSSDSFALSDAQAALIYERLMDEAFLIRGLSSALAAFILDFLDTFGKRPDSLSDELMFSDAQDD